MRGVTRRPSSPARRRASTNSKTSSPAPTSGRPRLWKRPPKSWKPWPLGETCRGAGLEVLLQPPYLDEWRVLLRLSSKASHPGDLNHPPRELSLSRIVVLDTRRPPGLPGPRGCKPPSRLRGAATLRPRGAPLNTDTGKPRLRAAMRRLRAALALSLIHI